jgi:hypothetical protein
MSLARRVLASASLAVSAAGLGSLAFDEARLASPAVLVVAAVVGGAAVGLSRRSVVAQVLSRGVAWFVLAPMLLGVAESIARQSLPDGRGVFFGTTSAVALLLARPALHTETARAEFSPVAYRRVFLAGAAASIMTACALTFFALQLLFVASVFSLGLGLCALSAGLVASAVGVLRMRGWGVLLGGLTSLAALGGAFFATNVFVALGLVLTAIPGMVLASPLVFARLFAQAPRRTAPDGRPREVTFDADEGSAPAVRARIAAGPDAEGEERVEAGGLAVAQK